MQYNVMPRQGRSGWKVEANGRRTSKHRFQQTAIDAAKDRASPGDEIKVHNRKGQVRNSWTVKA